MASKDKSASEGNKTPIIVALIGLIGTLIVAYLTYRGTTDPARDSLHATQTAEARIAQAPPTNTNPITLPTETIAPTLEPNPLPPTVTFTVTPAPLIASNCLFASTWEYTPRKIIPTDGCWKIPEFEPLENGIQIAKITPIASGEQQRGFYTILNGNADIQFVVNISAFEAQKTSQDKTKLSNLAFGIVEGSPFNYFNGVYVYYYASKRDVGRNDLQVAREQDVSYNSALNIDRDQTIRFKIEGKQLTVSIDGIAVEQYTLTFTQNAFYFGYRLFEETELNALLLDLSITP